MKKVEKTTQRQSPGGGLQKIYSEKFRKNFKKTPVPESFLSFCMIGTSVMKELMKKKTMKLITSLLKLLQFSVVKFVSPHDN